MAVEVTSENSSVSVVDVTLSRCAAVNGGGMYLLCDRFPSIFSLSFNFHICDNKASNVGNTLYLVMSEDIEIISSIISEILLHVHHKMQMGGRRLEVMNQFPFSLSSLLTHATLS